MVSASCRVPTWRSFPEVLRLMREKEMTDVLVIAGGIIPEVDRDPLLEQGLSAIFGPGTSTQDIVAFIRNSRPASATSLEVQFEPIQQELWNSYPRGSCWG